jgi:hypothetical protein
MEEIYRWKIKGWRWRVEWVDKRRVLYSGADEYRCDRQQEKKTK